MRKMIVVAAAAVAAAAVATGIAVREAPAQSKLKVGFIYLGPVGDFGWMRLKGYLAWLVWLFIHIFQLIGFRNRLSVMTQWALSYLTYQRSVRLITNEDSPVGRTP